MGGDVRHVQDAAHSRTGMGLENEMHVGRQVRDRHTGRQAAGRCRQAWTEKCLQEEGMREKNAERKRNHTEAVW